MTDTELNAIADGIFLRLVNTAGCTPIDAITILGVAILKIYEKAEWNPRPSIEKFTDDIGTGLLTTWKTRSIPAPTSYKVQ